MPQGISKSYADSIWAKLSALGWGIKDLAAATKLNPHYVTLVINGWSSSPRARRKIEACLKIPIWCSLDELRQRLPLISFYGCDIATLPMRELVSLCQQFGLLARQSTGLKRSYLSELLADHCKRTAARPDATIISHEKATR